MENKNYVIGVYQEDRLYFLSDIEDISENETGVELDVKFNTNLNKVAFAVDLDDAQGLLKSMSETLDEAPDLKVYEVKFEEVRHEESQETT